jgi:hypothetical protein
MAVSPSRLEAPKPVREAGVALAQGAHRQKAPLPQVRPVATFPETGSDAWRKANDAIIEKAANDFNTENGLKPEDGRYMDPQLMKVWAMVESGGSKDAFLSDPFQVNNAGDWDSTKLKLGLEKGKAPGPRLSAYAALRWLDKKGHNTIVFENGVRTTTYRGLPYAFFNYNGRNKLDPNGKPHKYNYVYEIYLLYHGY